MSPPSETVQALLKEYGDLLPPPMLRALALAGEEKVGRHLRRAGRRRVYFRRPGRGAGRSGFRAQTGEVEAVRLEALANDPGQLRAVLAELKASQQKPGLARGVHLLDDGAVAAVPQASATNVLRHPTLTGAGVAIGIVDYGFDVLHPSFLDAAGRTRFLALWDQNAEGAGTGAFAGLPAGAVDAFTYGRVHDGAAIHRAVDAKRGGATMDQAFQDLGYDPRVNYYTPGPRASCQHGTHVLSIAGGSVLAQQRIAGVAPEATLIAVQLGLLHEALSDGAATGDATPAWNRMGDSDRLAHAVQWIVARAVRHHLDDTAAGGPGLAGIVVNLSLGMWAGPHDGGSRVEAGMDALLDAMDTASRAGRVPPLSIVVAAGNASARRNHVGCRFAGPQGQFSFEWTQLSRDSTADELEIWVPPGTTMTARLSNPQHPPIVLRCGAQSSAARMDGVGHHVWHPNGGDRPGVLNLLLFPVQTALASVEAGKTWTIELDLAAPRAPFEVNAWVERDNLGAGSMGSFIDNPSSQEFRLPFNLNPLACGGRTVAVGGIAPRQFDRLEAWTGASCGPRPWRDLLTWRAAGDVGRPHVAAVSEAVWGAAGTSGGGVMRADGTSLATPQVVGLIALMMQAASEMRRNVDGTQLRAALCRAATAQRFGQMDLSGVPRFEGQPAWHPRVGHGMPDVRNAITEINR